MMSAAYFEDQEFFPLPPILDILSATPEDHLTLLILDDDPLFLRITEKYAKKRDLRVLACSSIDDVKRFLRVFQPDAAILDFQISPTHTIMDEVELFDEIPVLLTSRRTNWIPTRLPDNFAGFIPKRFGAEQIVREAIKIGKKNKNYFPKM